MAEKNLTPQIEKKPKSKKVFWIIFTIVLVLLVLLILFYVFGFFVISGLVENLNENLN